jgi:DNA modification methylase
MATELRAAELVPIDKLLPATWNANRVPPRILEKIRNSFEAFGMVENLVARPHPEIPGKLEVVSGNHRLGLLEEMGISEAPVVVVELDDAHARLLAQTLNRTRGADDPEAYASLLESVLETVTRDQALALLPETDASLERALNARRPARLGDIDDLPETPPKADSEPGQVYELGPHRLLCGDATEPGDLAKLMAGERADLLLTDPPYNVDYGAKTGRAIANDALDEDRFAAFLEDAFAAVTPHVDAGAGLYCWYGESSVEAFRRALRTTGWYVAQTLIWAKTSLVLGRQDYQWRHEACLYGWKRGSAHRWYGGYAQTTVIDDDVDLERLPKAELVRLVRELRNRENSDVIEHPKPHLSDLHPMQKPVAILEGFLWNSSEREDVVLDPFAGSGSTLIASEQTGRRCFAAELDPHNCDVIRARYERLVPDGAAA